MGRRSFGISFSQINRMISASNAAAKAREREKIINSQRGIATETEPIYELSHFDFNEKTRVAHIDFLETKYYRKIERYVTKNYVRYPIYGGWNTKTKKIRKTIKLTNQTLENLRENEEYLIRTFCYEIISSLAKEDFYPSWFIISAINKAKELDIDEINKKFNEKIKSEKGQIKHKTKIVSEKETEISSLSTSLKKIEKKHEHVLAKTIKAKNKIHLFIFSVLTLGIYLVAHSTRRVNRLEKRLTKLNGLIAENKRKSFENQKSIDSCKKEIETIEGKIKSLEKARNKEITTTTNYYDKKTSLVEPLPTDISSGKGDFVLLKKVAGMNYEKIIGCYVLRNRENGKCYVGQSKDVLRRLCREHFQGTKPKNIIFAEDYYKSTFANKDDLFEVKIIRLNTKDELDSTEKELIEEYDSFNSGYNGTSGNN